MGPKVSESIYNWFQKKQNLEVVDDLVKSGMEILPPPKIGKKLEGKTFALTGSLKTMTRDEAKEKIRLLGGNVAESASKQTDYLIVGENPGSKLGQAKKLGVRVIYEKEFLDLLK